jgi:hypothetical protein
VKEKTDLFSSNTRRKRKHYENIEIKKILEIIISYTDSRTPWKNGKAVARSLHIHRTT